jgi:hypothetical protein
MLPVLHLDPAAEAAGTVGPMAVLGDQTLQPHAADGGEQVRPDLALLERRHLDAVEVWPAFRTLGT